MKHLTGLDSAFLYMETPETPMHVGGLYLIDLPAGYKGDYYEDVKAHIAKRMPMVSLFQRKLALMPFELANPVWVDDDDMDLDYHIRRIVLSKPGTLAQLEAYVARLHSSLLDRSRPLWECYVIEGLENGQVGFYSKVHHSALDGQAAIALSNALLDLTVIPREVKRRVVRKRADQQVGAAELVGAAVGNVASQYVKLVRVLPSALRTIGGVVFPRGDDGKRHLRKLSKDPLLGPKTMLNVSITNQRVFAGVHLPLIELKRIAKATNVTLNDVVLGLCAAALRRYLSDYGDLPGKPLIAGVPYSLREAGNTEMTNQVTLMVCNLATDIADPLERLQVIKASTTAAKHFTGSVKTVIPTDYPSLFVPWLMTGLMSLYGRSKLANTLPPPVNVAISNVPGPQMPLYLAGGLIREWYPVSIAMHGIALNITVQSYQDELYFGLTACRRALPDVRDLADYLPDALKELSRAVPVTSAIVPAPVAIEEPAAPPVQKTLKSLRRSKAAKPAQAAEKTVAKAKAAPAKVAEAQPLAVAPVTRLRRAKAANNDVAHVEEQPRAKEVTLN